MFERKRSLKNVHMRNKSGSDSSHHSETLGSDNSNTFSKEDLFSSIDSLNSNSNLNQNLNTNRNTIINSNSNSSSNSNNNRKINHVKNAESLDSPFESSSSEEAPFWLEENDSSKIRDRFRNRSKSLVRHIRSHASLGASAPIPISPPIETPVSSNFEKSEHDWYKASNSFSLPLLKSTNDSKNSSQKDSGSNASKKSSFSMYKKSIDNVKKGVQKSIVGFVNKVQDTLQGEGRDSRDISDMNIEQSNFENQEVIKYSAEILQAFIHSSLSPKGDVSCLLFSRSKQLGKTMFASAIKNQDGDYIYNFNSIIEFGEIQAMEIGVRLLTEKRIIAQGVSKLDFNDSNTLTLNLELQLNGSGHPFSLDGRAKISLIIEKKNNKPKNIQQNNVNLQKFEFKSDLIANNQHRLKELNIDTNENDNKHVRWNTVRRRSAVNASDDLYDLSPSGESSNLKIDTKLRRISNVSSSVFVSPLSPELERQNSIQINKEDQSLRGEVEMLKQQISELNNQIEKLKKSSKELENDSSETTLQFRNHFLILDRRLNGIESSSFNMSKSVNLISSEFPLLQSRLTEQAKDMEKYHQHIQYLENLLNAANNKSRWVDIFFYFLGLIIKYLCYIVVWLYKIVAFIFGKQIKDDPNLPGLEDLVVFMKQERMNIAKGDSHFGKSESSISLFQDEASNSSVGSVPQMNYQSDDTNSGYVSTNDESSKDERKSNHEEEEEFEEVRSESSNDSNLSDQLIDFESTKPQKINSSEALDLFENVSSTDIHSSFDEWYRKRHNK